MNPRATPVLSIWLVIGLSGGCAVEPPMTDSPDAGYAGRSGNGGAAPSGGTAGRGGAQGGSGGAIGASDAGPNTDSTIPADAGPTSPADGGGTSIDATTGDATTGPPAMDAAQTKPDAPASGTDANQGSTPGDAGSPPSDGSAGRIDAAAPGDGGSAGDADAGTPSDGGNAGGTTHVRFANFATETLDVCLRRHDATDTAPFDIGPLFAKRGIHFGLLFPMVTRYFDFAADQYDIRIVPAGASDCSTRLNLLPVNRDALDMPVFRADSWWTVLADGSPAAQQVFRIAPFEDERASAGGKAGIRFVNASLSGSKFDFGFGTHDGFSSIFTNVDFNQIGAGPEVSALGYAQIAPVSQATAVVRFSNGSTYDLITGPGADLMAGEVGSAFAAGPFAGSSTPLVLCRDLAVPTDYSDCHIWRFVRPPDDP